MYIVEQTDVYFKMVADENKLVVNNNNSGRRGKIVYGITSTETIDDFHEVWDEEHAALYGTEVIGEEVIPKTPEEIAQEQAIFNGYKNKAKVQIYDKYKTQLESIVVVISESDIADEHEFYSNLPGKYKMPNFFLNMFIAKFELYKADQYQYMLATNENRFTWINDDGKIVAWSEKEVNKFLAKYIEITNGIFGRYNEEISKINAAENMDDLHNLGFFLDVEISTESEAE